MERQIKGLEKTNDKCQCLSSILRMVLRLILKRYREKLINSIKSWTYPLIAAVGIVPWRTELGFVHIQSLQSWRRVGDNRHIPWNNKTSNDSSINDFNDLLMKITVYDCYKQYCSVPLNHWMVLCSHWSYHASYEDLHEKSLCCCRRTEPGGWTRCPGHLTAGTWAGGQWS